jgi:hypothetical protein
LKKKLTIHIKLFAVYILYAVCSLFFSLILLYITYHKITHYHKYIIISLSLFPIFYLLFYILNKKKYYLIMFIISLISLIIMYIFFDSLYIEYIYHEEYGYSIKDDYLFGLLKKHEPTANNVFLFTIISYPVMVIINIILFIKKIINDIYY